MINKSGKKQFAESTYTFLLALAMTSQSAKLRSQTFVDFIAVINNKSVRYIPARYEVSTLLPAGLAF